MKINSFFFSLSSLYFSVYVSVCVFEMKKQKERKKKNYAVYLDTFRVLEFNETFSLQIP